MRRDFRYFPFLAMAILGFAVVSTAPAQAGDRKVVLAVKDARASAAADEKLDGSVAFYFGNSAHPPIKQSLGEAVTNKKSNAFAKSIATSCNRAMLSALIAFQQKAQSLGGDAVVNIHSYYKKNDVSYDDQFECYAGFLMSAVTLKGDVVKLAH